MSTFDPFTPDCRDCRSSVLKLCMYHSVEKCRRATMDQRSERVRNIERMVAENLISKVLAQDMIAEALGFKIDSSPLATAKDFESPEDFIEKKTVREMVEEALGYLESGKGPPHTKRVLRNLLEVLGKSQKE